MYLISYGTRPEIIKLFPLINEFKKEKIPFFTLFTGQHKDLFLMFKELIPKPDFILDKVMEKGQSLNQLSSKIIKQFDSILVDNKEIKYVIVQGDTTSAYSLALSAFYQKRIVMHIEAGLRSNNKFSPFPEEINRKLISHISDYHFCPTKLSLENLNKEGISKNVFLVGNTVVDAFDYIYNNYKNSKDFHKPLFTDKPYILVTLHRRENRGERIRSMWDQLNILSSEYTFIYIQHPSCPESKDFLNDNIIKISPQSYYSMVFLIKNSVGIITDSGGLQEEATCANKKILICRNITEREETIHSGFGLLVNTDISNNINFLFNANTSHLNTNPYGKNVSKKIITILKKL